MMTSISFNIFVGFCTSYLHQLKVCGSQMGSASTSTDVMCHIGWFIVHAVSCF